MPRMFEQARIDFTYTLCFVIVRNACEFVVEIYFIFVVRMIISEFAIQNKCLNFWHVRTVCHETPNSKMKRIK